MFAAVNFNVTCALLRDGPSLQKCTMQNGNPPTTPRDTTRPNERETHFGPGNLQRANASRVTRGRSDIVPSERNHPNPQESACTLLLVT